MTKTCRWRGKRGTTVHEVFSTIRPALVIHECLSHEPWLSTNFLRELVRIFETDELKAALDEFNVANASTTD